MYLLLSFVVILYLIGSVLQGFYIKNPLPKAKIAAAFVGYSAIMAHGLWLALNLYQTTRVDLLMLVSLAFWFINVLTSLSPIEKRSIQSFNLMTFPLAAISVLLSNYATYTIIIIHKPQLFHLILATLTFTTISFSGIWAIILAVQDRKLRQKHCSFPDLFPSIESMEKFLFRLLTIGFLLLTTLIISSLLIYTHKMNPSLIKKAMLSFCIWGVLAILLSGRFYSGWRGITAIRWTFLGASLLVTLYFGSLFH